MIPTSLPITPGLDVAGTVAEMGEGVEGFAIGDAVIGMFPLDAHGGAAEYAVIAAGHLPAAPTTLPLADAAALPLTGLAALQAAVELGQVTASQTVLVVGAGGAVGGIVVQLAADAGATVTAVDGAQHADRLRSCGASNVVGPLDLDAGSVPTDESRSTRAANVWVTPNGAGVAFLVARLDDGRIELNIVDRRPLDQLRAVHEDAQAGSLGGKTIIMVR